MKKVLLLTTSLIFVQLVAFAQIRYGITGGLQSSKLHASASGLSISTSGLFGGHLGAVGEYAVNDNFFVRPEILLSFKGGSFKSGSNSSNTSLTYIEIPIQGVYKYEVGSGKLVGGFGPYLGFLLSGKDDGEKLDIGTDIKGFDAGLKFLGGYELTENKISINLFYNAGLANISPSSAGKLKNSTFGLSITYFLGE